MTARLGRRMTSRIRARGWLRTEAPLHVGGLGHDPSEPLPIAVDGLGRLYVPGTSLAGALRTWSLGADPETTSLDHLWGFVPTDGDNNGHASRLIVADALITTDPRLDEYGLPAAPLDPALLEYRPSVGIDRVTRTAATEFLYGRAVVPAGCHLRLEIDIESDADAVADEAGMGAFLDALANGEVRLGAATSRGFGAVRLLDHPLELVVDRLDTPEGLLAVFRNDPARARTPASPRDVGTESGLPRKRELLDVRISWLPRAPVMVRSGTRGLVVDTLPLTTRIGRKHLTLAIPGGSIKGALRAHAEFVERTARAIDLEPPSSNGSAGTHSAAFRAQLDQLPAIRALFGAARDDHADRRASALRAEECTSTVTVPDALWRSVTGADVEPRTEKDRLLESVRDRLEDLGMSQFDHVALDRWTGGAADGRLFSVLEPHAVEWEPIRLSIDLTRLGEDRDTALALLLLTLRDLAEGRIPLGAATNRGFGDLEVTAVTLAGGPWPDAVSLADVFEGPQIASITEAWDRYLALEVS